MFDTNAMRFPSGEKLGEEQDPILAISATVRLRSSEPVVGTIAFCESDGVEESRKITNNNARVWNRFLRTAFVEIIDFGPSVLARYDVTVFLL